MAGYIPEDGKQYAEEALNNAAKVLEKFILDYKFGRTFDLCLGAWIKGAHGGNPRPEFHPLPPDDKKTHSSVYLWLVRATQSGSEPWRVIYVGATQYGFEQRRAGHHGGICANLRALSAGENTGLSQEEHKSLSRGQKNVLALLYLAHSPDYECAVFERKPEEKSLFHIDGRDAIATLEWSEEKALLNHFTPPFNAGQRERITYLAA